jgi:hypothetical protein
MNNVHYEALVKVQERERLDLIFDEVCFLTVFTENISSRQNHHLVRIVILSMLLT